MTRDISPFIRVRSGARPLIALHGLGGSGSQSLALLNRAVLDQHDVVAPDLRAHGTNEMPFDDGRMSFAALADDVRVLVDSVGFDEPPLLMGVSMGAGVALQLQDEPERFAGVLLVRPAWAWTGHPSNLDAFPVMASLLGRYPVAEARQRFLSSDTYAGISAISPAAAVALLAQFDERHGVERRARLTAMPADAPRRPIDPVLGFVLATPLDPVHPLELAEQVALDIGATFELAPPRYNEPEAHRAAIASALSRL